MNWKKIFAVVRREYVERIRTKAFWIGTLAIPILLLGFIGVQIAVAHRAGGDHRVAVVDLTGKLFAPLSEQLAESEAKQKKEDPSKTIHWVLEQRPLTGDLAATKEALRKEVVAKKINAYLILDPAQLSKDRVEYYSTTVSEFAAMNQLESAVNHIRLRQKIADRGLPTGLAADLEKRIDLKAFRVTATGTAEEKGAGIVAALVFFFLMYSTFFMYGYQVMRGVIEEKSNRIVEVIVASVRPTELMLGKILGIGLVGLTQYAAWSLIAANLSLPGIATAMASSEMGVPRIPASMVGFFLLFFLLGYFLYASVYTAIAAPFNTDQEAHQLAMIPMFMILGGIAVYPAVMNNPSGGIAVFFSLLPFTAPLTMFLRTALSEPPVWQILVCAVLLVATTIGMAWLAGRIYRIGILMYGKKPTIPEIVRWIRYTPGKGAQPAVAETT
ncbi:MAG TPA: ABC transporter permease [Thermoanaerobaculia bacterium]|nr:ABC transporter permease [Thermoanaerobaculia bacterium]